MPAREPRLQTTPLPDHTPEPMLAAGGAVADAMRMHDWKASPLGAISGWPQMLRATVATILAAPSEIVLFWGPDHVALYNDAYAQTIGDQHPRALGRPARENLAGSWDDLGPLLERVYGGGESVVAKGRPFYIERSGQSEEAFYDTSYSSVRSMEDGAVQGVLCIVAETTERVRSERRVQHERAQLSRMFEQAPGFMALLREPGHVFEFANTAYQQLIGHRAVLGRSLEEALPEIAAQGFGALLDEVVATRAPHTGRSVPVSLQRRPQGPAEERLLDFIYQPIVDETGAVTAIFVEGSDVTERVRAEEKLSLSESTFRLAADAAEIGTWNVDVLHDVLQWDRRTKAMFGISSDMPSNMTDFYAGLHPDDLERTSAAFASALDPALRATYDVEYRTIGKEDGIVRWVAAKGRGIFVDGRCVRAIGTAIDITAKRRAQQELRESEERFRSLADSAPALIWLCDAEGRMVFANHWHEETFGKPAHALLGGEWKDIIHADDLADFTADFDTVFDARRPFTRDVRVIDRFGRTRWLHAEARPRFVEGRFTGYVGCDVDITETHNVAETLERGIAERTGELAATNRKLSAQIEERERVEATLRQMQRLEAVGQLTSGVAHDFNNLLTVILGNVDMVARAAVAAGLDQRSVQRLGHMRTAAERGATLTAQLLAFSRRQRLEPRATDLNEAVAGMRDLLQSSMGGSVRLATVLQPDLWPALVDATQIELIILNLAINARDAMAVGGALTVETANMSLGAPVTPEEPPAGDYVMIAVSDSGTGMTPEVLAKAFEPFFTTKAIGKGSGLGLAQVFGFARQSGGGVRIDTVLGEGTTVRVFLPRSHLAAGHDEAARPQAIVAGAETRGKRVLLVDDDDAVRDITAAMLRGLGCVVVEAANGPDGLTTLDRAKGGFDLLVLDFAMPGMNGAEVAMAAAQRWPAIPVMFVTGFADLSAIATVNEERIVQKPYRGEELQRKAKRLLTGAV